jgi:hypothetical protein
MKKEKLPKSPPVEMAISSRDGHFVVRLCTFVHLRGLPLSDGSLFRWLFTVTDGVLNNPTTAATTPIHDTTSVVVISSPQTWQTSTPNLGEDEDG